MNNTPDTNEMKCLSLIEVMELPRERRRIALGVLQAIKERDEAIAELSLKQQTVTIAEGTISDLLKKSERLERERDKAMKDAAQLSDRLSGLELRTTEELARLERERDEAHKIARWAIDDLGWFNETNAQRLRAELDRLNQEARNE